MRISEIQKGTLSTRSRCREPRSVFHAAGGSRACVSVPGTPRAWKRGGADIGRCTVWRAPSVSPSFTDACGVVDDPPAVALKKKGCFVLFCFYSTESFSPDVSTPAGRADGRAHSLPADTDPGSQPSSGSFWAGGTCPGPLGESAPPPNLLGLLSECSRSLNTHK